MPIARYDPNNPGTGDLYVKITSDIKHLEADDLWQVVGYITDPAAVLRNLVTGRQHVEVIESRNAMNWRRLIPAPTQDES